MAAMDTAPTHGPLTGVRVLELGSFIAGPFAGQLLGDYGADVIKVETPQEGDVMRHWGLTHDGEGLWWPTIARNKRSVAIDLRDQRGRDIVRQMVQHVDVVVENFRAGRLSEWGLGYDTLSAINPGLIVTHVSGFGQDGPRAGDAGFGAIGEAMGGIRFTTGEPDRPPARCGVSLGDALAGLFAVIGTLAALQERHRSGRGQEVDVAIYEAVAALMESSLADYEVGHVLRQRSGSVLPGIAPSNAYPTADGSDVLIGANGDAIFVRFCEAMGRSELATDERFCDHDARGAHMAELDNLIAGWTRQHTLDEVLEKMGHHGVPAGRIYSAADALSDAHYSARDMVIRALSRAGFEVPMTGVVPKFSRTPGKVTDVGPRLGEHTESVLREFGGLDNRRISELRAAGVVA